jgi:hypothetical protein
MNLNHPAWRERPVTTAFRVTKSLVRRALPPLSRPPVPYDGGRSRIHADLRTALGLVLYRMGPPSDPDLALLRLLLEPGDVFVDGGANVGLFTLVAAASVEATGAVVAFEPVASTRAALLANVKLNGFHWVDVRSDALDAEGGHVERVRATTLDEALGARRGRVRVLKIDLKGAEYDALRGARRLLSESGPDLMIGVEPTHLARAGASPEGLQALLGEHGYALYSAREVPSALELAPVRDLGAPRGGPNVYATRDVSRVRALGARILEGS